MTIASPTIEKGRKGRKTGIENLKTNGTLHLITFWYINRDIKQFFKCSEKISKLFLCSFVFSARQWQLSGTRLNKRTAAHSKLF